MKTMKIQEIHELANLVEAKKARLSAIVVRCANISNDLRNGVSGKKVDAYAAEIADLRKEVAELISFLNEASEIRAKFYAPATVI